jgi:hypothetical protein
VGEVIAGASGEVAVMQCVFTVGILRSALQVWSLAIVSKCMFILPFVDSILKRGEDERGVENGMSSFTKFESF